MHVSILHRCSHASPIRQEKGKKYQVISAKSHNVFFNFKTSRKKMCLFSLQNIKYKGERIKKKKNHLMSQDLQTENFNSEETLQRAQQRQHLVCSSTNPIYQKSNHYFQCQWLYKMQYHNSLYAFPVLQNCTDCEIEIKVCHGVLYLQCTAKLQPFGP